MPRSGRRTELLTARYALLLSSPSEFRMMAREPGFDLVESDPLTHSFGTEPRHG